MTITTHNKNVCWKNSILIFACLPTQRFFNPFPNSCPLHTASFYVILKKRIFWCWIVNLWWFSWFMVVVYSFISYSSSYSTKKEYWRRTGSCGFACLCVWCMLSSLSFFVVWCGSSRRLTYVHSNSAVQYSRSMRESSYGRDLFLLQYVYQNLFHYIYHYI